MISTGVPVFFPLPRGLDTCNRSGLALDDPTAVLGNLSALGLISSVTGTGVGFAGDGRGCGWRRRRGRDLGVGLGIPTA